MKTKINKLEWLVVFTVFCLLATLMFVLFYDLDFNQSKVAVPKNFEKQMLTRELSFGEDVRRFIQVYFNQPMNYEEKQQFVTVEYARFSDYVANGEIEAAVLFDFVKVLAELRVKVITRATDLSVLELKLREIERRLQP